MSKRFQMRMTSWRGLRFRFGGSYGGALATYTGWPLLVGLTFGALFPFWQWKNASWVVTNTAYGAQRFAFTTKVGRYYMISLVGSLLVIGLLVGGFLAAGALVGGSGLAGLSVDPSITDPQERIAALLRPGVLLTLLVPALVLQLAVAWFQAGLTNAAIGGVQVGPHRLESRLRTWPLAFVLVTNLLGIVLTVGLFYPWAKVRLLRYQLDNTRLIATGPLDDFTAATTDGTGAVAEEVGDFFDVDFGL
jgi:uncharacterized membrane protein YjgN (DUF898 family)